MDDLMALRFMQNTENSFFPAPPGVGKTYLYIALGMRAIMSHIPVHYTSAEIHIQTLKLSYDLSRLEYRIKIYSIYGLVNLGRTDLTFIKKYLFFIIFFIVGSLCIFSPKIVAFFLKKMKFLQ